MTPQEAQAILGQQSTPQAAPMNAANAQAILNQMPQQSAAQPQPSNLLNDIPTSLRAAAGDLATAGQGISNDLKGVISPFIPSSAPQGLQNFFQPDNTNYYNSLNVSPNFADNLVSGGLHYAAYANPIMDAVKGASLASDVAPAAAGFLARTFSNPTVQGGIAASAVNGGLQDPNNPLTGTAEGAGIGTAAPLLGGAGSSLLKGASNLYAKTALPGIINRAGQSVMDGLGNPDDAATQLYNNYTNAKDAESSAWNDTKSTAANLDNQLPSQTDAFNVPNGKPQFDSSSYDDYVNNYINKVKGMTGDNSGPYQQSLDVAQNVAQRLSPNSFTGAVNARQSLNAELANHLNLTPSQVPVKPDANTAQFIGGLKNVLDTNVIQDNAPNVNPDDLSAFQDNWNKANQATQGVQKFYNTTNNVGAPIFSPLLNSGLRGDGTPDAAILNEFNPTAKQTGTQEYQNLKNLLGSQADTQQGLLSYNLRGANAQGDGAQNAMNYYQKLSPGQQNYLFQGNQAQPALQAASKGIQAYGMPSAPSGLLSGLGHVGLHYGIPTALGYGAGLAAHLPWEGAALLGAGTAATSRLIGRGIGAVTTPSFLTKAINYGQSPLANNGLLTNYIANGVRNGN